MIDSFSIALLVRPSQTLDCTVRVPLFVPFITTGSGANDPHHRGAARLRLVTFVHADHVIVQACAGVEIIFVDPQPFDVDGASTLAASATRALLLWGPINHHWRLPLVTDKVCDSRADVKTSIDVHGDKCEILTSAPGFA